MLRRDSTELYTHYLLGDRDLDTFKVFVLTDLTDSLIVHDRYQNYDSAALGPLVHQLCCQHLLRDLEGAGEVYPDAHWPTQIAEALRELIHHTNLAREQAERDLRPSKVQQNVSGRLTSEHRTRDRYKICGYASTAAKHGLNMVTILRDALLSRPWMPQLPAPTPAHPPEHDGGHKPPGRHTTPPHQTFAYSG